MIITGQLEASYELQVREHCLTFSPPGRKSDPIVKPSKHDED